MGSVLYDFLADSFLFDDKLIQESFANVPEQEIVQELQKYREHCLANVDSLEREILDKNSNLKVFSCFQDGCFPLLKQSALYLDQVIIDDPLFKLTYERTEMVKVLNQCLGLSSDDTINRAHLTQILAFFKNIIPMIITDYVKLLPVSHKFEPPNPIPVIYTDKYHADILPKEILTWFYKNIEVHSLKKGDGSWIIEDKLYPTRGIFIAFKKHTLTEGEFFHLFEQGIIPDDEEKDGFSINAYLPETPPDLEYFNAWVFQSINKSAKKFYDKIYFENIVASKFNASYLTDSEFTFELLQQHFDTQENIKTNTINAILNFELPFIEGVNIDTLMKVRISEGEAFESFRIALEQHFRELRTINNPEELTITAQNIIHELNEVQVHNIERQIKNLKKKIAIETSIGIGGLAGAIQTGGWSLIATAIAATKGLSNYRDYLENVRDNPSFFLWKLKKKSKL
jgi:hypothetical protein